jgi:hypothetical protein
VFDQKVKIPLIKGPHTVRQMSTSDNAHESQA